MEPINVVQTAIVTLGDDWQNDVVIRIPLHDIPDNPIVDRADAQRIRQQNRRFNPTGLVYPRDAGCLAVAVDDVRGTKQLRLPDIRARHDSGDTGADRLAFIQRDMSYLHAQHIGDSVVFSRWQVSYLNAEFAGAGARHLCVLRDNRRSRE